MRRAALALALILSCLSARADDDPPRLNLQLKLQLRRGPLKDGFAKARKTSAPTLSATVGAGIGSSHCSCFSGRGGREVPALVEADAAGRQADIALGIERRREILGPPSRLDHGDRVSFELHGYRGDGVRGEVVLEVTDEIKGDEKELLTTGGACIRKMGMFTLGKTYQLVSTADADGNATWVEFVIEKRLPEKE
jgi:hypothetical protein